MEQRLLVAVQEVVAPVDEPLQRGPGRIGRRGCRAGAPPGARGSRRAPRARARSHVRRRARSRAAARRRAGRSRPRARQPRRPSRSRAAPPARARGRAPRPASVPPCRQPQPGAADRTRRLARDVERLAARRQDPHPGALRQERRRDARRLVEDVLARVEDDERAGVAKPRGHACERVGAANVERRRRGAGRRRRASPARAKSTTQMPSGNSGSSERAVSTASRLLPTPGGPVSVTRRCSCSSSATWRELVLAADERRRRRREVAAAPAADRDGGDRRVVREDRLLEPPELGPRLEPQLVGEHAPRLLEGLERVRLAPAAVERQHQLPPQPLAERVVRQRRAKRGRELAMLAERERDLELLLERIDVQRLEPARLARRTTPSRSGPAAPAHARAPAPTRPRPPRQGASPSRSAARVSASSCLELAPRRRARPRAAYPSGEPTIDVLSERSAKAGDVVMERVPRSGRQLLAPEAVDERVDRRRPGRAGARASPAGPAALSRPRPRASRRREPRTGREAGSPVAPAWRRCLPRASLARSPGEAPPRHRQRCRRWHSAWQRPGARSSRPDTKETEIRVRDPPTDRRGEAPDKKPRHRLARARLVPALLLALNWTFVVLFYGAAARQRVDDSLLAHLPRAGAGRQRLDGHRAGGRDPGNAQARDPLPGPRQESA